MNSLFVLSYYPFYTKKIIVIVIVFDTSLLLSSVIDHTTLLCDSDKKDYQPSIQCQIIEIFCTLF